MFIFYSGFAAVRTIEISIEVEERLFVFNLYEEYIEWNIVFQVV